MSPDRLRFSLPFGSGQAFNAIMDILQTLGIAAGLAALAGVNLYLAVFVSGLAIRFHWLALSPAFNNLDVLGDPVVITVAGVLYFTEFFADKIPWVDSAWDFIHTVIRPLGAAALAVLVVGRGNPTYEVAAALLAGGVALSTHLTKASVRLLANASPEPASNIGLSLGEDALVIAGLVLIAFKPVIALVAAVVAVAVILYFLPQIWRGILAKSWLIMRKLNCPADDRLLEETASRLPGACETILRRVHAGEAPIAWAMNCLSGGGPRLPSNYRGWLIRLVGEDDGLFFVCKRLRGPLVLAMDVREVVTEYSPGFLSDKLTLTHHTGEPRHTFLFERGMGKVVRAAMADLAKPSHPSETVEFSNPEPTGARVGM
jgi:hypothetical protein